jgi:hypothetical protein
MAVRVVCGGMLVCMHVCSVGGAYVCRCVCEWMRAFLMCSMYIAAYRCMCDCEASVTLMTTATTIVSMTMIATAIIIMKVLTATAERGDNIDLVQSGRSLHLNHHHER